MSLFVQEEDESHGVPPQTSIGASNGHPHQDLDQEMMDSIPEQSTFDGEEEQEEEGEDEDEDEDPVVSEIPIIFKPLNISQDVSILQYPGRPHTREFTADTRVLSSNIKPNSKVIEIQTPLDTTKFYDEQFKYNEDLSNLIKTQTHSGNMIPTEGSYIGSIRDQKIVLLPVDSVSQLRPALAYIDKDIQAKKQMHQLDARQQSTSMNGPGAVQVVQMSVKSSSDTTPRLGGALLSRKHADEEDFVKYQWKDLNEEGNKGVKDMLFDAEGEKVLISQTQKNEYVEMLVKETAV